jgi:hypothetical protein
MIATSQHEHPPSAKVTTRAADAPAHDARRRRSPYPAVLGHALLAAARVQVARWDRALLGIEEEQERILRNILGHAARTEFGRRFDFRGVKTHDDFVRRVPIGDYDKFSPYIERMRRGERNLLVPEFVRYYGNSSGSSNHGKSKFLPITERQIAHQRRAGADTLMRYLVYADDADFLSGFTLGLFPSTVMKPEGATFVTSNPALMSTRVPAFTRPVYLPDDDIRGMTDYSEKLSAIADRYFDYDVRALAGTTCWFPVMLEKLLETARARGRQARNVRDIWPNLRVLLGGGVSSEPYLPIVRRLIGRDDVTLVDSYNATEGGIYAASDHSGERGMLMLPHRGTFFEFVPLEERDRGSRIRVPLWAVEPGRAYSIVVTTVSGLYAYELGDIVRFTSTNPLRIEFAGRLSGCLSLTQELTTHVEVERAVSHALTKCGCRSVDFGAAADVGVAGGAKSRYVLFVEFDEGAAPVDLAEFTAAFDAGMCAQNRVYREHRTGDVAIVAPRVLPLVRGGARRFLDTVTRGNVQGKFPRILDDARRDELLAYTQADSANQREGSSI